MSIGSCRDDMDSSPTKTMAERKGDENTLVSKMEEEIGASDSMRCPP